MSASYRSTDWFPSSGSGHALSMLDMDNKGSLASDHSVYHDQDVVSDHSLCGNTSSANSCGFRAKPFYNGGYEHAADTPWSFHSHADLGFEKVSRGIYNERIYYGGGLHSPDFQTYASLTQPSLQPFGELSIDNSRHIPAVDPFNYPHPIPENVHFSQQFSQENLPINSDRFAFERSFGVTESTMRSLGSSGLRHKIFRESRGLGFMSNGAGENGVPGLDYSLKPFSGESSCFPTAMARACVKHSSSSVSDLYLCGSRHGVSYDGFESASSSSYREHPCNHCKRGSFSTFASASRLENDNEARPEGSYGEFFCRFSSTLEILAERNTGPRASRLKGKSNMITHGHVDHLSQHEYKDAKFFVIKSYSEDNVHKSIKYGVWASTTNGNKKLDAAYREAKEKDGECPVFLLFSVNASAQFCGVVEMVGPVDFNTSVEYWQQDRWTGHFPVKWLVIKDVPNSLFCHIILENNDNKPVTNSRDTQEVGLEQGLEMLSIFNNYEMHSSILDDFSFYEERQRAMQRKRERRNAVLQASAVPGNAAPTPPSASLPNELVKKMSKSFAEALALNQKSSK